MLSVLGFEVLTLFAKEAGAVFGFEGLGVVAFGVGGGGLQPCVGFSVSGGAELVADVGGCGGLGALGLVDERFELGAAHGVQQGRLVCDFEFADDLLPHVLELRVALVGFGGDGLIVRPAAFAASRRRRK
jgi:hypothetical protein